MSAASALPGSLWWEEIAGPARYVADVEAALSDGRHVMLETGSAFPYLWAFRDEVSHWIDQESVTVTDLDARDADGEPGEYLIQRLAPSLLNEYRRRERTKVLQRALNGKLVWLRELPEAQFPKWIRFLADYRANSSRDGLVLLETETLDYSRSLPQSIRHLRYEDFVREDDLRLFLSLLAEEQLAEEGSRVRQYAVGLVSALCVTDSEIAEALITEPSLIRDAPLDSLEQAAAQCFPDGQRGRGLDWHPLELLRQGRQKELLRRVWTAQLRTGYPLIEIERLRLIETYYPDIREALATPYPDQKTGEPRLFTDSAGVPIQDPYDLEIGMLDGLLSLRHYEDGSLCLLYLPDPAVRERIRFLHNCRNALAHLNTCTPEDFYQLLQDHVED